MIYIAADRHGYKVIEMTKEFLVSNKIDCQNLGVTSYKKDMKLEDMIPNVVENVRKNKLNKAILSCGTGVGIEVGANKFSGIRACLATNTKIAEWSRIYDDCNVLCLVGWNNDKKEVHKILKAWFNAKYDGSKKRLKMFKEFDKWH